MSNFLPQCLEKNNNKAMFCHNKLINPAKKIEIFSKHTKIFWDVPFPSSGQGNRKSNQIKLYLFLIFPTHATQSALHKNNQILKTKSKILHKKVKKAK